VLPKKVKRGRRPRRYGNGTGIPPMRDIERMGNDHDIHVATDATNRPETLVENRVLGR
jgi:hypothetical protein